MVVLFTSTYTLKHICLPSRSNFGFSPQRHRLYSLYLYLIGTFFKKKICGTYYLHYVFKIIIYSEILWVSLKNVLYTILNIFLGDFPIMNKPYYNIWNFHSMKFQKSVSDNKTISYITPFKFGNSRRILRY